MPGFCRCRWQFFSQQTTRTYWPGRSGWPGEMVAAPSAQWIRDVSAFQFNCPLNYVKPIEDVLKKCLLFALENCVKIIYPLRVNI